MVTCYRILKKGDVDVVDKVLGVGVTNLNIFQGFIVTSLPKIN
jgi:hypothetical protein